MLEHETFMSLLRDKAHWEFELFIQLLIDGLIGAVLWPLVRSHMKKHHNHEKKADRDTRDDTEQTCVHCLAPWTSHWRDNGGKYDLCRLFKGQDGIVRDCTDSAPPHMSRR